MIAQFFTDLRDSGIRVNVFLRSGIKLHGHILTHDVKERAVILGDSTGRVLIFLDAVSTIVAENPEPEQS